jgi:hypothetical protein
MSEDPDRSCQPPLDARVDAVYQFMKACFKLCGIHLGIDPTQCASCISDLLTVLKDLEEAGR